MLKPAGKLLFGFWNILQKGNIDLECDGEKYHILPEALAKDRTK